MTSDSTENESSPDEEVIEASLEVTPPPSSEHLAALTRDERRALRKGRRQSVLLKKSGAAHRDTADTDERFTSLIAKNEDDMLNFVAQINKLYEQKLKKPAPFMTWVFIGMQSAGKSTIMERFMNAVLNIVQEGTGTRCPLDVTCIHDGSLQNPLCELQGEELPSSAGGEDLSVNRVFEQITEHNKTLANEDRFSTEPLRLTYRASNVQNMRFVDTPGIITTDTKGKDNREDIKHILRSELQKPNTKLCVLLEPQEIQTNSIINFCDVSLVGREKWMPNAVFLMTKFDMKTHDSRTASKANAFFRKFHTEKCYPHVVITPTLPKEDLPSEKLFAERKKLLSEADAYEQQKFEEWIDGHEMFRQELGESDRLNEKVASRVGFPSAKKVMRQIMLEDTAKRLPEVLSALRQELDRCEKEKKKIADMTKFQNPSELKAAVGLMLSEIDSRIQRYLNGDLETALKFPELMQTLDEEIDDEEESEWSTRELNFYTEQENDWRDRIARLEDDDYPEEIQAGKKFLGGKQYQRAVGFFRSVMIDALPDPYKLRDKVPNVTGYLNGGLQRENWERATVEIVRVCLKQISHPGINYLVKHVGNIFRRLFRIALDDIKKGEEFSSVFKLLPRGVEKFLLDSFDEMLWGLMVTAANKTHCSLEPMYSTVDPSLPTFHPTEFIEHSGPLSQEDREKAEAGFLAQVKSRFGAFVTGSGEEAKRFLKKESRERSRNKRFFLPEKRTAMITEDETEKILKRSFEYIVGLMDWNLINLRFQLNHYLFVGFRTTMRRSFYTMTNETDWDVLVEPDPDLQTRSDELEDQISSLKASLQEVQRMNRRF